jgi:hypothetical protein
LSHHEGRAAGPLWDQRAAAEGARRGDFFFACAADEVFLLPQIPANEVFLLPKKLKEKLKGPQGGSESDTKRIKARSCCHHER